MATTASQTVQKGQFSIDTREHGYADGPAHVLVELSPVASETYMAVLAAGSVGRYSFDFAVGASGIEVKKAYVEGMRSPVGELPAWVEPVKEQIEKELGL